MDSKIVAARDQTPEEQRRLFYGLARHLYDNQVRDNVTERDDPSDNDQWLANLATWFGWPDQLRDEVKRDAIRAAVEILDHEMPDQP